MVRSTRCRVQHRHASNDRSSISHPCDASLLCNAPIDSHLAGPDLSTTLAILSISATIQPLPTPNTHHHDMKSLLISILIYVSQLIVLLSSSFIARFLPQGGLFVVPEKPALLPPVSSIICENYFQNGSSVVRLIAKV